MCSKQASRSHKIPSSLSKIKLEKRFLLKMKKNDLSGKMLNVKFLSLILNGVIPKPWSPDWRARMVPLCQQNRRPFTASIYFIFLHFQYTFNRVDSK